MTEFLAHATKPRYFHNRSGAIEVARKCLLMHESSFGELFKVTSISTREVEGSRLVVVLSCDITQDEKDLIGEQLYGFYISVKDEEAKPVQKPRKSGQVTVEPGDKLFPCRANSKQQLIIDLLTKGATLEDLRTVCIKRNGTVWDDSSIKSALYYDVKQKGYGVRTEWREGTPVYHLVLPAGYDAPEEAKGKKSS